ncbi:MAG: 3-phosphoshikimate 1-carboxyvinyltransferase [Bacteroidales bacterium]|nr:3-phosphoshikimate 1-carboxyvinyltransferase [Bacteroidales bacterium]
MNRSVEPSFIKGDIKAPPSKSMTQRAIAAALLADGTSVVTNPSGCDDSLAAMSIATGLGAEIIRGDKGLQITGSGKLRSKHLNCGESGLAIRMFSPIAALCGEEIIISGTGSLRKRPMSMITDALDQLGVNCKSTDGYLPLTIRGPVRGGNIEIDGSVSSQLLTGLLMALPVAGNDSAIRVRNLKSKPYIDMTIGILGKFGIRVYNDNYASFLVPGNQKYLPVNYEVEGDWSGGAFLLVAAAINGNLSIYGLDPQSSQSDKSILNALENAGARVMIRHGRIDISKSAIKAFEFDATESPDLFPPLVALASYSDGTSAIKGVSRLIYKESDRAYALQQEFGKMGIKTEIKGDLMYITGGTVKGAVVDSHGDHRIAMAAAVAALGSSGRVVITGAEAVAKSYPGFFDDLCSIGAMVT